jgi:hypothetical protein
VAQPGRPRFVFALPRYAPGKLAERLGMQLLVCVADRDHETPDDSAARVVERAPQSRPGRPAWRPAGP